MKLKLPSRSRARSTVFPIGEVTSLDVAGKRIVVKTDTGPEVEVLFDGRTTFFRVAPGARDLKNAQPVHILDIGIGDRVLVRGVAGRNRLTFRARSIFAKVVKGARGPRGRNSEEG